MARVTVSVFDDIERKFAVSNVQYYAISDQFLNNALDVNPCGGEALYPLEYAGEPEDRRKCVNTSSGPLLQ